MGKPSGIETWTIFVREYMVDRNGTAAYMRTRPKTDKRNATKRACELLSDKRVRKMIAEEEQKQIERTQITSDKILQELMLIARADLSLAFNDDGTLKAIHDIPLEIRRAISGIETIESMTGHKTLKTSKVKFWDKVAALGLLGKHLRLFQDKIELGGEGGGPVIVRIQNSLKT